MIIPGGTGEFQEEQKNSGRNRGIPGRTEEFLEGQENSRGKKRISGDELKEGS